MDANDGGGRRSGGALVRTVKRSFEARLQEGACGLDAAFYGLARLTREKREPFWLPVRVVSALTGLAPRTLRNRAILGEIPSRGFGKRRRLDFWAVYDGLASETIDDQSVDEEVRLGGNHDFTSG